jgi:hypothetical protein
VPYWLCTHRELHTNRRIRRVFDLLAKTLSEAGDTERVAGDTE